ncbi:hypothetical protein [Thalassolituus sp. C2-1]|uniref:hypothetical protein n=1 Tax=Venatorbacter sp. C2-1 TaxID=2597518 RepID=UPI001197B67B|nr:hypothetical protein [Thalassolituus sp. C2-1]TVV44039.1 hypothetical protein FOT50_10380 [Thalassolituus sp. C2-1]
MAEHSPVPDTAWLISLVEKILDNAISPYLLRAEVSELAAALKSLGHEHPEGLSGAAAKGTLTANGLALAPDMAATCADDAVRTIMFLRGTRAAIADQYAQGSGGPVRILYAGCGPYAILAVPLMLVLSAEEASFTLIDIHPESVASAERIITALNLADTVFDMKAVDATGYLADPDFLADIILTEVMQACLQTEPQVAVVRHLLSQSPSALVIPQEIRVDLVFADPEVEFSATRRAVAGQSAQDGRVYAGSVFILNNEAVFSWKNVSGSYLPGLSVEVNHLPDDRYQPMLFTDICVYQQYRIGAYESGLTFPRMLESAEKISSGAQLHFQYRLGDNPGVFIAAVR